MSKRDSGDIFAVKLASIGVGTITELNTELLKHVSTILDGADSPECDLEYLMDGGLAIGPVVNVDDIKYYLVVYSYINGDRKKVLEANRGEFGKLYVNYLELTRKEAEDLLIRLKF